MTTNQKPLLIIGAGLTGSLVALALARLRPEVEFLLIEQGPRFGGGPVPPFFASSVAPVNRWLIDSLIVGEWDVYHVAVLGLGRTFQSGVALMVPEQIHAEVLQAIPAERVRLRTKVVHIDRNGALLMNGEVLDASLILDARGGPARHAAAQVWCQTTNRTFRFPQQHGLSRPILVDATLPESSWAFLQYLPLAPDSLLVRYIRYSADGSLRAVQDESGYSDGGRLVSESVSCRPLLADTSSKPSGGHGLCVDVRASAVELWHPILSSPVAGAVSLALAVAGAAPSDPRDLASRIGKLEARAREYQRQFADVIRAFGSDLAHTRSRALRAFYGLSPDAVARIDAGNASAGDIRGLEENLQSARRDQGGGSAPP